MLLRCKVSALLALPTHTLKSVSYLIGKSKSHAQFLFALISHACCGARIASVDPCRYAAVALDAHALVNAGRTRIRSVASSRYCEAPHVQSIYCAVMEGLKYAESHEWVKVEGDTATVGISEFAQVRLPLCSAWCCAHCPVSRPMIRAPRPGQRDGPFSASPEKQRHEFLGTGPVWMVMRLPCRTWPVQLGPSVVLLAHSTRPFRFLFFGRMRADRPPVDIQYSFCYLDGTTWMRLHLGNVPLLPRRCASK
jgi:hypothetical protein